MAEWYQNTIPVCSGRRALMIQRAVFFLHFLMDDVLRRRRVHYGTAASLYVGANLSHVTFVWTTWQPRGHLE